MTENRSLAKRDLDGLEHLSRNEKRFVELVGMSGADPLAAANEIWPNESDPNRRVSELCTIPGLLSAIVSLQQRREDLATTGVSTGKALGVLGEIMDNEEVAPLVRQRAAESVIKTRSGFFDPTKKKSDLHLHKHGSMDPGALVMIIKHLLASRTREQYDEIVQTLGRCVETGEAVDFVQLLGLNAAPRRPKGKPMRRLPAPERNNENGQ